MNQEIENKRIDIVGTAIALVRAYETGGDVDYCICSLRIFVNELAELRARQARGGQ